MFLKRDVSVCDAMKNSLKAIKYGYVNYEKLLSLFFLTIGDCRL